MAESKPRANPNPLYGRRNQRISNTAEEGELCLYAGHSLGRFSSHSMRYDSHQACVRCIAAAREGRMSLDINRLMKKQRQRALKFWSKVDIAGPDDCWEWRGTINAKTNQPQFAWRRPGISSSTQHHPQRVAMWFSWGDLGYTGVKTTCGNRLCCNPFHIIPQNVGVYVDHDVYLESFDLACELHTLKQQVAEYMMEQAMKEAEKKDFSDKIDAHTEMMLNPMTDFGDRYQAVLTDILEGRHITQTNADDSGLFREPTDHGDDNPTHDY